MTSAVALAARALPRRLAERLGHGVSETLAARLQTHARLRSRLDEALAARLGRLGTLDDAQRRMLAMTGAALEELARQAGAVCHAPAIAALVHGAEVRALVQEIGAELRALALRSLADPNLAGCRPDISVKAAPMTADAIAAGLLPAGVACVCSWAAAQPAAVAERLALCLPDATVPEGGEIVAWLLAC